MVAARASAHRMRLGSKLECIGPLAPEGMQSHCIGVQASYSPRVRGRVTG
jgi:hypothetical protein